MGRRGRVTVSGASLSLAAAEVHLRVGPFHPSVASRLTSARLPCLLTSVGRSCHGGTAADVLSSCDPLAVVCSIERKGIGLTLGDMVEPCGRLRRESHPLGFL